MLPVIYPAVIRSVVSLTRAVACAALAGAAVASPPAVFDREPNDSLDAAEKFRGQARVIGVLSEGDADLYWWSVDDAESDRLWTLELTGETDGEVRVELLWPADEEPESGGVQTFGAASSESADESETEETALYALTITSRRSSATSPPLIVPPGKHLVRVTGNGGDGDYRFNLTESGRARIRGTAESDDTEPLDVSPTSRPMIFQLNTDTHRVTLNPEDNDQLWRVSVASELGAEIEAQLVDADDASVGKPVRAAPLDQNWSRSEIGPGAGLRLSRADGEPIGRVAVGLEADGQRAEMAGLDESEADEVVAASREAAIWVEPDAPFELDLQPGKSSWLAFDVDDSMAERSLDIDVTADGQARVDVCLLRRDNDDDVCREGPAPGLFYDLQLDPGAYRLQLRLAPGDAAIPHVITLRSGSAPDPRRAAEPNDEPQWAAPLDSNEPVAGRLNSQRSAWFDWKVTGEPQLWRIEAEGEAVDRLRLYRVGSRGAIVEQSRPRGSDGREPLLLDGQWLVPGHYRVRVHGDVGDYTLATTALGQPDPGFELEPNNDPEAANAITVGEPVRGRLHTPNDEDHFFFHSPGRNRLVFDLDPPAGGRAQLDVEWQGQRVLRTPEVEQRTRFSSVLPSGEFRAVVAGSGDDAADYALGVDFASPWSAGEGTQLFMPTTWLAEPFPADGRYNKPGGNLGARYEYLALPVTGSARDVAIETPDRNFEIVGADGESLELRTIAEDGARVATLPGGTQWYLKMGSHQSDQSYLLDDPALPESATPDVTAALELDAGPVAAFAAPAQRIPAQLTLTNNDDAPVALELRAHVSQHGSRIDGLASTLELAAGASRVVDFDVLVPADLADDSPLAVFVDAAGVLASDEVDVAFGAEPTGPEAPQQEAESFYGLVDLAWSGLGGWLVDPESGEPIDDRYKGTRIFPQYFNDGMAAAGSSVYWREDMGVPLPPLQLAGNGGELHAFVFNQRSSHPVNQRWYEVEIRWGEAADDLPHSMIVSLDAGDGEQFFELDSPSAARFVQLRPLSARGSSTTTGTGLFRALGKPAAPLAEANLDILDNDRGGHWIYSRPADSTELDFPWGRARKSGQRSGKREVDVAFGFLQQRIARLGRLVWEDDPDRRGEPIERVQVLTSTESPVGPWDDHGEWLLERNDDMQAQFEFSEPVRARYLRLVIEEPGGDGVVFWRIPVHIAAFEADALGSGNSALAYWGMDDQYGPWEPESEAEALATVDDRDSSPGRPWSLEEHVTAELAEPGDVRSYRVRLDEPDNTLSFTLDESMSGRLRARLVGAENEPTTVEFTGRDGRREAHLGDLAPGEYRLDVEMPPRSIVFLWDGSGSVSAHQPAIFKALGRFAEGLEPGQEVANVMPLDGPLLVHGWAEYPSEITQTLAGFTGSPKSSNSEPALITASRALAQREGEQVIFLITDAQLVNRDLGVWDALDRARPRIFTLEIAHGKRVEVSENRWYQNLMKSWANVANGRYRYTVDRTELIRGFEAGMRELRRPTRFALTVSSDYREPPKPGTLEVHAGDQPVLGAGVVHLIFDASGSMLQRMEGGRRIDVARQTVLAMLAEHIPDSVPIGLRAYGHTEPHSCASELLVAPDDGSHAAVVDAVDRLRAVNLARTPLAASLDAVPDDLAGHGDGRRLVVMLTDGEETCDGDVAAAVEALVEQGLDVRLNIVGFQIDELELQDEFEQLAALGGGAYFDSQDGAELATSLSGALAAPFRIVDAAGTTVARGRVGGEAIELDAGDYHLHVEAGDGDTELPVRIAPGQAAVIRLDESQ